MHNSQLLLKSFTFMIIFSLGAMDALENAVLGIFKTMTPQVTLMHEVGSLLSPPRACFLKRNINMIIRDITLLHDRYYIQYKKNQCGGHDCINK